MLFNRPKNNSFILNSQILEIKCPRERDHSNYIKYWNNSIIFSISSSRYKLCFFKTLIALLLIYFEAQDEDDKKIYIIIFHEICMNVKNSNV